MGAVAPSPAAAQAEAGDTPPSTTEEAPTLQRGSRGKEVKKLQRALGLRADGAFGAKTERALKRFQRAEGIPVTGVVDTATREALGWETRTTDSEPADPSDVATEVVAAAESAVGTPYASGGTTTSGFDCSGLTSWAFKKAGVTLPRTSYDQYDEGDEVESGDIEPGDLVFFDTAGDGASHVGIATSATTAISATSSGVMEHSLVKGYWGDHYIGARRVS